ncbi:MAG: hypothetical protein H7276_15660 [Caulobacter sp.]|nr:hypothetical protein [Vitreoscilla sp.]
MRQIVVGTFDQQDSARAAIAALANDRFDPRRVHAIETHTHVLDDDPVPAPPPPITDDSVVDHLRNFLAGLFGVTHDVSVYAAAMRRGGAVVRVDVEDQPEAVRAELAFVKAGAIDITRRTRH